MQKYVRKYCQKLANDNINIQHNVCQHLMRNLNKFVLELLVLVRAAPNQLTSTRRVLPCVQSQRTRLKTPALFLHIPAHRNTKCYRAKEPGSRLRHCSFTSLHTGTPSVTEPKNRAQDSGNVPLHPCTQEHQVLQSQRTRLKTPAMFLHVPAHRNTKCYRAKEQGSRLRHCSFTSLHTGTPSVTEPKNRAQDSGTVPSRPYTHEHRVLQSQRTGLKPPALIYHMNTNFFDV